MELSQILALPIVDREQFDMLVMTGEDAAAELIQELLDLFRQESAPRVDLLRQALSAKDTQSIVKHAHSIAGASGNLGAYRLSQLCRQLEVEARQGFSPAVLLIGAHVRTEFDRAIRTFDEEIAAL